MPRVFPAPSPSLGPFTSLLLRGPLPPSAAVHLCLSHLAEHPSGRAVLVTPSRASFVDAIKETGDPWVKTEAVTIANYLLATRTHMFHPPTLAHLRLCLASLRSLDNSTSSTSDNIILDTTPTLVVLHNLSAYFIPPLSSAEQTVSSFMTIVIDLLQLGQSISSSSKRSVSIAIIDPGIDTLRLPLVVAPPRSSHMSLSDDMETESELDASSLMVDVSTVVERYFEQSGFVIVDNDAQHIVMQMGHANHP